MPLLLDAGVVAAPTSSEAVQQVEDQRAGGEAWWRRMEARKVVDRNRAEWLRAFVAVRVTPDLLDRLDGYLAQVYPPSKMETEPVAYVDFWLRVLRDGADVLTEGVDPELASSLGYPPVPISLPVSMGAWRVARAEDPAYEAAVLKLAEDIDARRLARQGGEQMDLFDKT